MSIQLLSTEILWCVFDRLAITDLETLNQVCKGYREQTNHYMQASFKSLSQEINDFVQKTFNSRAGAISEHLDELNELESELAEACIEKDASTEEKIINLTYMQNIKMNQLRMKKELKPLRRKHARQLEFIKNANNCANLSKAYRGLLHKKVQLLIKTLNFETTRHGWKKDFTKISDLTLTGGKMAMENLVRKKMAEFGEFIEHKFACDDFFKFKILYHFDNGEELDDIKNLVNEKLTHLKAATMDLNTLRTDFTPLRLKFVLIKKQPNSFQCLGKVVTPPVKITLDTKIITQSSVAIALIDGKDQEIQDGIELLNSKLSIRKKEITFPPIALNGNLDRKRSYRLLIKVGSQSVKTDLFKVLSRASNKKKVKHPLY